MIYTLIYNCSIIIKVLGKMLSSHQATISDARRLRKSGSYNSEQSGSGNIKKAHKQMQ